MPVYSSDELLKLRKTAPSITRPIRKNLFKLRIWCPKSHQTIISGTKCVKRNFHGTKCGLLNPRSINNKESSIHELITDNKLDLLALTETWAHDRSAVSLGLIVPAGYSIKHIPRSDRKGGGVGLIFRDI